MSGDSLKVGDVIEVTTERLAYGGDAVARHEGLTVFTPLAAPGERLRVRVTVRKKNYARAEIEQILAPSPARREPPCAHFGNCGGCQLQHMTYEAQLEAKAAFIRDALNRVGKIDWPREITVRHGAEFGYRARAQIKLEQTRKSPDDSPRVGFHRTGSHSVCDITDCPILVPELDDALRQVRSVISQAGRSKENSLRIGGLTQIEMAAGESGVAFDPVPPGLDSPTLRRTVRGAVYTFDARTFFQVNARLLEDLVDEATSDQAGRLAIDLYAGVGLFTIQLARGFDRVIGVEYDARSSRLARQNARLNDVSNVEFYNASAETWLRQRTLRQGADGPRPDLVLLDPPRAGAAGAVELIPKLEPRRIVYVSCDPTTLARDLRSLIDSGYEMERVTGIDLFPQTYHVETVAALKRR